MLVQILIPGTLSGIMNYARIICLFKKLFFCFTFFSSGPIHTKAMECSIDMALYQQQLCLLDTFLPQPIIIDDLHIVSDIFCDDLAPLIALKKSDWVDAGQLKKMIFFCALKNKFKTVTFHLDDASLSIYFESFLTFDRLHIDGFIVGKNRYKRFYLINPGDQFNQVRHDFSCAYLKKKLEQEGYFAAAVHDRIAIDQQLQSVKTTLKIEKGSRFTINKVFINSGDDEINSWFANHCASLNGKYYAYEDVDKKMEHARHELLNRGYIYSYAIENHTDKMHNTVDVEINIHLTKQRKFMFSGNSFFSDDQLRQHIFLLGKSAWIIPADLVGQALKEEYHRGGFSHVCIQTKEADNCCTFTIDEGERLPVAKPVQSDPFDFIKQHNEGPNYRFGKTIIQNCTSLPSNILLRELAYQEGEAWDYDAVQESIARLNELEVFDSVQLTPVHNQLLPDQQTMVLKVHTDDPYEIRIRAGLGLQQMSKEFTFKNISYVAGGAFIVKNPFNRADQFRIDADYTHGEQTLSLQYIYPWLLNMPIKTIFEVYATSYLQPGLRHNQKNLYNFVQQGFTIGNSYKRGMIEANCNTGIEWMKTNIVDKDHPLINKEITRALNFEPLLVDKKIPYILIEPSLVINNVHDKLNPKSGSLSLISLKGMFPLKYRALNSYFVKIYLDQAVYIPIQETVLALRARAGHIFYKDFKNVMPAERFYLGGANSIRSYETDMCPPLGTLVNIEGKECFVPQGSRSMVNLNAELRVPIYANVTLAVFQDLGALSNNYFADIKRHDILAGSGLGLRYNTPIGPLRFDFAFKWHRPDPKISGYCWFLSFGNAF